jgi:hypothetical protein
MEYQIMFGIKAKRYFSNIKYTKETLACKKEY